MKSKKPGKAASLSFFTPLLVAIFFISLLCEFYLGRNFSISIFASSSAFLFVLLALSKKEILYPTRVTALFLIYLGWNLFASLFSIDLTKSLWENIRLVGLFLFFLNTYNISLTKDKPERIIRLFALTGSVLVFLDLLFFVFSGNLSQGLFFSGFLSWHNQMAGFLLLLIPLLIASVTSFPKTYLKILGGVLIFASGISLILTYSRGGWIVFLLQMAVLFFLMKKVTRKHLLLLFVVFIIFLGTFAAKTQDLENRLLSIPLEYTSLEYINQNPRLYTWDRGIAIFIKHPFVGVGPGAFGLASRNFQTEPWLFSENAHNHFLEILAESGLLGLIIFTALIVSVFRPLPKNLKKNIFLSAVLISLLGLITHSLIDYDFSKVSLYSAFWLLAGFYLSQVKTPSNTFALKNKNIILYPAILLFLVLIGLITASEDAYLSAEYSMTQGDYKTTEDSINRAITLNPYSGKSYLLAAEFYYNQKDTASSTKYALKAEDLLPYDAAHYTVLGAIEADKGNFSKAETYYRKAVDTHPFANPNAYTGLAYALERQGKTSQAEEILTKAVEEVFPLNTTFKGFEDAYFLSGLTNDLAGLYIRLARLKILKGEEEKAQRLFQIVKDRLTVPQSFMSQ